MTESFTIQHFRQIFVNKENFLTTRARCVSVKWNANRLLSDFLLRIEFLLILCHSTCVRKFNLHLLVRVLTKEVLCELCVSHTYVLRLIVRCSSGVGAWKWGTRKLFFRFPESNENVNSVGNSEAYTQVII